MFSKAQLYILAAVMFVAFTTLSLSLTRGYFTAFDFDATVKIQDRISDDWRLIFSVFSILGSVEVTSIIWLILILTTFIKKYWWTLISLSLFIIATIIEVIGKLFIYHPGPPKLFYKGVIDFDLPSHIVHTDYSYPSGHLTRTAFITMFLSVWLILKTKRLNRLFGISLLVLTLIIMAISRVYLGEHWTTDVLGGLFLGSSFGVLAALTIPSNR